MSFGELTDAQKRAVLADLGANIQDSALYVDVASLANDWNKLAPTAANAQHLVDIGIRAIDEANDEATGAASAPGETQQRNDVRAHLDYYNQNPDQLADGFWDIKDHAGYAFAFLNSVTAATDAQTRARTQLLTDLKNIPWEAIQMTARVGSGYVKDAVNALTSGAGVGLGVPQWAIWLGIGVAAVMALSLFSSSRKAAI